MGREVQFVILWAVTLGPIIAAPCGAQQPNSPVRRPSDTQAARPPSATSPRLAAPRTLQPQVVNQPQQRAAAVPPVSMPEGFPLDPAQQARVDQILKFWEHHTSRIKTHECKFERKNYDFVFGNKETPTTIDDGTVRYKVPDKGLFRVDRTYELNPKATDPKQKYVQKDVQFGEYWVCDGESIYQFDARTKVLTETKLPPHMQGKAIAEGPLPFLFGAKAEEMKARYWIREVTPTNNPEGDFFLEAIPQRQEDAANFNMLWVRLKVDKGQLFPHAIKVDKGAQGYVQYEFQDHSPNSPVHRVQGFLDSFVRPTKPPGWTKIVEDWDAAPVDPRQAARPEAPEGQADHPLER
jgi:TIGR03009 family protein